MRFLNYHSYVVFLKAKNYCKNREKIKWSPKFPSLFFKEIEMWKSLRRTQKYIVPIESKPCPLIQWSTVEIALQIS